MNPSDTIKHLAASLGLDACGIASIRRDRRLRDALSKAGPVPFAPENTDARLDAPSLLPGAASAIVVLFPYKTENPERGNLALYARPADYHRVNHRYLERLSRLAANDFPDAAFYPLVDTSPLVDRWLAWQAGLGFYGKNHCLIHPRYGSFFTIGALLTTLALPADTPLSSRCGDCRRCIAACPGRALSETGMNPWHCKSYLTQKKDPLSPKEEEILCRTPCIFGCDECQNVCPWNEKAAPSPLPEIQERRVASLSMEMLSRLSNRAFEKNYRDYAFAWRGKKILLRNLELLEKSRRPSE